MAIAISLLFILGLAAWYLLAAPKSQLLCATTFAGRRDRRAIALTFDDGPGTETPLILDILRRLDVKATFFLCGANVEKFPETARRIALEGHAIGNHTYSHAAFIGKSPKWMRRDIEQASSVIEHHIGSHRSSSVSSSALFRPPYGIRWFALAGVLRKLQLEAVMWDVNSEDWKRKPEGIFRKVIREAKPGSIVLLHDGVPPHEQGNRDNTVKVLPCIIAELSTSYELVTVPQLIDSADLNSVKVNRGSLRD
jgi:peptidoglycan-N-acetylglucosamine deacetylase